MDRNVRGARNRDDDAVGGRRDDGAVVKLGSTVSVRDDQGRVRTWQVVAPDESEPTQGRMSARAPLAQALLNHGPGERVAVVGPMNTFYVTIEAVTAA